MNSHFLIPIARAGKVKDCGNKAVHLSQICRLGLRSSDGHVLVAQAFHQNIARLGLTDRVTKVMQARSNRGDEAQVLRELIQNGGLSEPLHSAVSKVLNPGAVYAVRSSAVGEDGAISSFAGQYDSILECDTLKKVEHAICCVWASLLNARALAYADKMGTMPPAMAVILQRQVAAFASGVLFTRDPRDTMADHMVLDYCDGLGEQLVSGQITPASGRIDRNEGSFVDEKPAENAAFWTPKTEGAGSKLREIGLALETQFGCPQDIEFSVDETGQIVVLQSRAITTLAPLPEMVSWSNANIAENFPDPVCPILKSFVARGYGAYFRSLAVAFGVPQARLVGLGDRFDEIVACHSGRLYYNLTNIHSLLFAVPGGKILAKYFNTFTGAKGLATPSEARPVRVWELFQLALMPFRILLSYATLGRRLRRFEALVDTFADEADPRDLSTRTPKELALLLERFLEIRLNHWTPAALSDAAAMISYGLLGSILRDMPDVDENELLQGLPGLASAMPVEALWVLSQDLKKDAVAEMIRTEAPEKVLELFERRNWSGAGKKIQDYLQTWGFRSSGELVLVRPTPQEDPLSVIRLLRAYLHSDDQGPIEKSAQQANVRKERTLAVLRSLGVGRRQVFRVVLWATQTSIGLRERARMKQALLYSRLRHITLAAGAKMVSSNDLPQVDDVFSLELEEAVEVLRGAEIATGIVRERQQEHIDNESWTPPDCFVLPEGQFYEFKDLPGTPQVENTSSQLTGIPACAGRFRGTAVVVLDVSDIGIIENDQILVTRQTDPGWAAVFFLVKGLVIERGGLLSHGAIIAREYGIPAVIGVEGATKSIRNGATIEVLGDLGAVHIHVA